MAPIDTLNANGRTNFRAMVTRCVLMFVAVALRFACKYPLRKNNRLGWDDFWILAACLSSYATEGFLLWGIFKGKGGENLEQLIQHQEWQGLRDYLISLFTASALYPLTVTCLIFSILAFYNRIFAIDKVVHRGVRILAAITFVWFIAAVLGTLLVCKPMSHFWNQLGPGKCGNFMLYFLITSIAEVLIDVAILALPVRAILQLSLPWQTRWTIVGIFFLGGFVVITGIIRVRYVYQPGVEYVNYNRMILWTTIHITSAIVCACLPLYRPLWSGITQAGRSLVGYSKSLIQRRSSRSERLHSPSESDRGSDRSSEREKRPWDESDGTSQRAEREGWTLPPIGAVKDHGKIQVTSEYSVV